MRVLVPLNNISHIDDYIQAGAEEFYIGFYDEKWWETFGEYADINRLTGFKKDANPYSFEEVIGIIQEVKKKGKLIYVTFNASQYSTAQLEHLQVYMEGLKKTAVDGVIVSCAELVELAAEQGLNPVISTIGGIYNSETAGFYAQLGAKRIILPRDLSVEEIQKITEKVPEVEYEIFMMRNGCRFSDAHCLGFHRSEKPSICSFIGRADRCMTLKEENFKERHDAELNDMIYSNDFHNNACGLCALYRFVKMGITAGKIVGRSDEWQFICRDIHLIMRNITLAESCKSEEEYLEKMIFPEDKAAVCKLGLSCYYPEIRF